MKKIVFIILFMATLEIMAQKTITITGHRGGGNPENTLSAIKMGLDRNAERIEIDIQSSQDDIVVLHDKSITRTTTGKGEVKNYTYSEIKDFKIIDDSGKITTLSIPTLEEVLDLMKEESSTLLIEVKAKNIEQQVYKLLVSKNMQRNVIIQSFDDEILIKFHKIDTSIVLHKLFYGHFLGFPLKIKTLSHYPHIKEFSCHHRLISKRFKNKIKLSNRRLNVWTVNEEDRMRELISSDKVDGIITDRPDILNKLLVRSQE